MFNINELLEDIANAIGGREKLRAVGDHLQGILPVAALLAVALTQNQQLTTAWLYTVVVTAVIVYVMKYVFNYTALGVRPDGGSHSFPSAHTSAAFSGAWVFVGAFGWAWAAVPLALACLTGFSRVYADKHHWRDVIAGAAVAGAVAFWAFTL